MPCIFAGKDVTVKARGGQKILLNAVSGSIDSGYCAIMGPSGSGKTTLLNTLACRLDHDTSSIGELRLNGMLYSNKELKAIGGYVMQDDVLNAALTVQETLDFTAELRLPSSFKKQQRDAEVDRVLGQMGLEHCRKTIIGSPILKGISGGERKRVCIAMELLTSPHLLFLDEPTSGLDSVSALSICQILQVMGASGECTIVCTIHQPAARIFNLFHNLLLLKKGQIVYQGPANKVLDHFAKLGFECPMHENPADHIMTVITPSVGESAADLQALEEKFQKAYQAPPIDLHKGADRPLYTVREVIPWYHQTMVLFRRTIKEQYRKRNMLYTSIVQTAVMGVMVGTIWLNIGTTPDSASKRSSVLFFCTINQVCGMNIETDKTDYLPYVDI
jgi:ATP-binding cassette subfamily G (WHITE) protein 2